MKPASGIPYPISDQKCKNMQFSTPDFRPDQKLNQYPNLGPLRMILVTRLAQLAGQILSSVHMGNFSLVTELRFRPLLR